MRSVEILTVTQEKLEAYISASEPELPSKLWENVFGHIPLAGLRTMDRCWFSVSFHDIRLSA